MKKTRKLLSTFLVLTMLITVFIPVNVEAATQYEYARVYVDSSYDTMAYSAEDAEYDKAGGKYFGVYTKSKDVQCICYKKSENGKPKTLYKMPKGYGVCGLLTNGTKAYFFIYKYNESSSKNTIKACEYSFKTGKSKVLKTISIEGGKVYSEIFNYYDGKVYFVDSNDGLMIGYLDTQKNTIETMKIKDAAYARVSGDQERYFYISDNGGVLKQYDCKTDKVIAEIDAGAFYTMYVTHKGIYLLNYYYENDYELTVTITKADLNLKEINTLYEIKKVIDYGERSSDGESLYICTGTWNDITGNKDNKKFIKFEFNTESATEISMNEYLDGIYYREQF